MRNVESKAPVEKQQHEMPDDWSIPDFLRRPIPSTAASPTKTSRNQSVAT
jgi:hypothetical protein